VSTIAVLGAGSWGTVIAHHLASKGAEVLLWARDESVTREINQRHHNPVYLPGKPLAASLRATANMTEAAKQRDILICAVPSQSVRRVLELARGAAKTDALLVCASKGIEIETLQRMSEVAAETLPGREYVIFSGPSFAIEVFEQQPTAVVAASRSATAACRVQQLFSSGTLRVYTSEDVLGTELAGSFKNVVAIAAGMCEGLGLGNNPRAALVTRGLAEITRLGVALGADPSTFAGLAGVGDLVLTTCGTLSRNRALGVALGRGESLAAYTARQHSVIEGVPTAKVALRLARRAGVELPIAEKVAECLFESKPPRQAIVELMERTPKPEQ
jgi:glycerol-3-phosphate dehydrogenase (NAD(P)+)